MHPCGQRRTTPRARDVPRSCGPPELRVDAPFSREYAALISFTLCSAFDCNRGVCTKRSGSDELWIDFKAILDQSQHVYNVLNSIQVYLIETYG